ncbi:putative nepenthesin [Helianthus annuus]|uniref:Nepenthesin n=1 Tax=Helianthus annuus TaxID=4232 RepID=A0A9K3MZT8_HELAN|nr:putative nepenthesin [Helianthus annuus]KAJ0500925.1 putative nepenthesin [Helianthus annuus]KAJ0508576.1 putative nepenthesin [Helianthus annuus]KAJ0516816.1 putative nepenthesin [Helianthus annuus]KAJ0684821.1 putative nepenthesin [Helianthus annuus]
MRRNHGNDLCFSFFFMVSPNLIVFILNCYFFYCFRLYYTKVQLGSPSKDYYLINTGSDVLWVGCTPCNGCPTSSSLQIPMEFYDPSSSSKSHAISFADQRCSRAVESSDSSCLNNQCTYKFKYGDGNGTSGYYVSDLMHFETIAEGSRELSSSADVVFGTTQMGDLTKSDRAINGILGLGQNGLSIISQLSSQGAGPDAFSHCLIGSEDGGGILVIGQIVEANMVYTPLIQLQPRYNINLQSISINGQRCPLTHRLLRYQTTKVEVEPLLIQEQLCHALLHC